MLPPKNGKPITFKPTPQLRERIEKIADMIGVSLSDYVRKAVEEMNAKYTLPKSKEHYQKMGLLPPKNDGWLKMQEDRKVEAVEHYNTHHQQDSKQTPSQTFSVEQLKELERETGKPTTCKTFGKGGKHE